MAPAKSQGGKPAKRKRRTKARTQVSSSESSDTSSSSESESEVEIKNKVSKEKEAKKVVGVEAGEEKEAKKVVEVEAGKETSDGESDKSEPENPAEPEPEPKITFSAWYLRQVAKELEEDLDKVRSAGDFSNSSLPVLIHALQQGASTFTDGEKKRIIAAT
ncbi:hypothetical protein E2P81_ATG09294 [Venturia nashicola]|uniref:Ribosome assembly protein 3 n=1 Tax=Venturia nashicola TaxID=86259 RepID=A0A4Z1NGG9_9PEZI|nr:hypothetical protein E6O75_ATG09500 [Venturia nashicola]TLD20224.1 hypothetical protein E2P81_ATG09294 [Venturia nashicola]